MAQAFSVASWNVEHFGAERADGKPQKPIEPIIEYLAAQKADVIAVYEVRSSLVFQPMVDALPGYQFHITEGPQAGPRRTAPPNETPGPRPTRITVSFTPRFRR